MEETANDIHSRQLGKDLLFLLGNIEENILSDVQSELMKLGVTSVDDLQWVEEEDFKDTIKPVLVRKLLRSYKAKLAPSGSSSGTLSSLSSPSLSPVSFSPKSPPPIIVQNVNRDPNWPLKLEIPWNDMSHDVCKTLQEGKRLSPTAKKELVNKTVDAIRKKTEHASKYQVGIIAQRIVAKFPDSLEDRIDGAVFGSGYQTLLDKMVGRNENCNRPKSAIRLGLSSKKRSADHVDGTDVCDNDDHKGTKTKWPKFEQKDSYGCVKWCPPIESEEQWKIMEGEKDLLKDMYSSNDKEISKIDQLMASTYPLQRRDINSGGSIRDLKVQWPFLFDARSLQNHARELLDVDVRGSICNAYRTKAGRLNSFFRSSLSTQSKNAKCSMYFEEAVRQSNMDNLKSWLMAVVLCILDHFGEKEEDLFHVVDDTTSVDEIERSVRKEDPMMVVLGDSIMAGTSYLVIVDGTVVTNTIGSFIDALSSYFAAFYVFNLEYPSGTSATLEFIQRCFVLINPDKGSKGNKGKKKKRQIAPKVLKLVNSLADFEWMDV